MKRKQKKKVILIFHFKKSLNQYKKVMIYNQRKKITNNLNSKINIFI